MSNLENQLNQAMTAIRSIESAQYGYNKYKARIESCFSKITESDLTKLAEYGLFTLATQDEGSQDALLTAFRAGFLSPKQQKATTGQKVATTTTASVPTTSRDFLARRLDAALKAFGETHSETLCSGIAPHALVWEWPALMQDSDFEADYSAIAAYESRFSRFVAALPFSPTGWKPVSDSHIELSIGLAEFSAIQPQPQSARFDSGEMRWIVPVTEPVEPIEPEAEAEAVKPKATTAKATPKAKVSQ